MLKLKLQYFGHLMQRVDSLEKTLRLGGIGGRRRRGWQRWDGWMASLTWWTWVWVNSGSWWWTGRSAVLRFMGSQRVGHDWGTDLIWERCKSKLQWGITSHQSEWPLSKNLQTMNAGEGVEKREPSYTVGVNVNWYSQAVWGHRRQPAGSWWRGLTECGPLEKGMANHFSILVLRTPWTVWKGKKIGHWKMKSPGR